MTTADQEPQTDDSPAATEKPVPTDEHKQQAKEMAKAYEEDRPTTVLPGSDGTISGTAINDWLDDDGKPLHGKEEQREKEEQGGGAGEG